MEQRKTTWFVYGPWWLVAGCLVGQALYDYSVSRPRAPRVQLTQEQRKAVTARDIKTLTSVGIIIATMLLIPLTYCLLVDLILPAFGTAAKGIGAFGGNVIQCIGNLLDAFIRLFDNL